MLPQGGDDVQTYTIMRIETCPVKRTNNLSPFCEWIIFIGETTRKGLSDAEVDDLYRRFIVQ